MGVLSKGTKLYSVAKFKCPACQEGDLFLSKNPYDLKNFANMPANCTVCKQPFVLESGFYWGSMYVNYILSVAIGGVLFLLMHYLTDASYLTIIITMAIVLVILSPIVFRLSRAAWINIFVKYAGK